MRQIFTCVILFLLPVILIAQGVKGKVVLTVLNEQHTPMEGATVELLRQKDSVLVKTAISDKIGVVEIDGITPSAYLVRTTAVGFNNTYSKAFDIKKGETVTLPSIHLSVRTDKEIQEVTVSARKPFIQRLNDRLIVNVDNSVVNAVSSAIDVLERSPSVTINQNDNIILRGRQGVIIMIDGRVSPMTGADLANYLRGLLLSAIDRIEIITNPSSKYDAAGNAGIIDIRLKKDQRLGNNGTITAGYGQGVYPKTNGGSTFNYRNKSVNLFGNYNYGYRENLNHLLINRNFFTNGVLKGTDDKDNYAHMPVTSAGYSLFANNFKCG